MGAEAIGFAIPIDDVIAILPLLIAGQPVPRPTLGMRLGGGDEETRAVVVKVVMDAASYQLFSDVDLPFRRVTT